MKKTKIIGYISTAVLAAIGAIVSQVMVEKEIDERLSDDSDKKEAK